ncbi:dihydrodipicolinate synthase family protein [Halovenus rubra]|uniref:Dihydrodipicolinate synthase family protein n=2 Tax=Halovenus rubra TaxID=869890 RepID=A0ABD5X4I9_9EURY|nr:dihydrodipicolinate synthase family protein [Halovenus rubra]
MHGIGPPLVTPCTEQGDVDYAALRELVGWVENRGVDFLLACGSTSEAELLTAAERKRVVETVVEEASVPVLAGTGHPGLRETLDSTAAAVDAGADAALVVTPFYYNHGHDTLVSYYRAVADSAEIPVYLYSVPGYTDVQLTPKTVAELASHPNIAGMKDTNGSLGSFIRTQQRVADGTFDLLIGTANILSQALSAGARGGVLALANLYPRKCVKIHELYESTPKRAQSLNAELVDINTAVTTMYGIPGLKWAMRQRGAPAGYPRSPQQPPDEHAKQHLASLLAEVSKT